MNLNNKNIKIQIYPTIEKVHTAYSSLISNPPKGYTFIGTKKSKKQNFLNSMKSSKSIRMLYKFILKLTKTTYFLNFMNSSKTFDYAEIIFSLGAIYYGNKPWIVDIIDNPYCLAGYDYDLFKKNKNKIENSLASSNCKAIICANETSLSFMKKHFSNRINKKVCLIRPAVKFQNKKKRWEKKKKFQMLFIGSINNPDDFLIKGGLETLECFNILNKKHNNIHLMVKCKVPEQIKEKYSSKNINYLQDKISIDKLEKLYLDSDILLMPGHTYFLMAFLEAMSFGLPIVTLNTYAVKDYIINKKNGFTITPSKNIPYNERSYPVNVRSKEFFSSIKKIDKKVINELSKKIEILINNPKIKEKMSKESLKIVKLKFSIEKRNNKMKKLFEGILK